MVELLETIAVILMAAPLMAIVIFVMTAIVVAYLHQ